jgi:hypothetical protein
MTDIFACRFVWIKDPFQFINICAAGKLPDLCGFACNYNCANRQSQAKKQIFLPAALFAFLPEIVY